MQRYFVPVEQLMETQVFVTQDDAHHLMKVMRANVGDRFIASNGVNREVLAEITEIDKGMVTAEVVEELVMNNEPLVEVWVAQSLPKGDKMEAVIQKCTEIGATRFIPFVSQRTVVQYDGKKEAKRLERWQKIAKEAAEQAHRNRVPIVESPFAWKQLLQLVGDAEAALFCYEKEEGLQFRDALTDEAGLKEPRNAKRIILIVGPEGGFTEQEAEEAEAAGCKTVRLGKRILRTETAAMVGLTCILYESGEMGGR